MRAMASKESETALLRKAGRQADRHAHRKHRDLASVCIVECALTTHPSLLHVANQVKALFFFFRFLCCSIGKKHDLCRLSFVSFSVGVLPLLLSPAFFSFFALQ